MATTIEFDAPLNEEGSWGERAISETAHHIMTFTETDEGGYIEWEIQGFEEHFVTIGLWIKDKVLTDYDGVFSLPDQAITLLESAGIQVPEDFR